MVSFWKPNTHLQLQNSGIPTNVRADKSFVTALSYGVRFSNLNTVKYWVKHFPKSLDTSVKGHNMFGASILTVACFRPVYNRFEIFRALLDGGAKLDEIRPNNGNVFHALAVRLLYSMLTLSPHNLTDSKYSLHVSRTYLFFFGLVKSTKKSSASWYVSLHNNTLHNNNNTRTPIHFRLC